MANYYTIYNILFMILMHFLEKFTTLINFYMI